MKETKTKNVYVVLFCYIYEGSVEHFDEEVYADADLAWARYLQKVDEAKKEYAEESWYVDGDLDKDAFIESGVAWYETFPDGWAATEHTLVRVARHEIREDFQ